MSFYLQNVFLPACSVFLATCSVYHLFSFRFSVSFYLSIESYLEETQVLRMHLGPIFLVLSETFQLYTK